MPRQYGSREYYFEVGGEVYRPGQLLPEGTRYYTVIAEHNFTSQLGLEGEELPELERTFKVVVSADDSNAEIFARVQATIDDWLLSGTSVAWAIERLNAENPNEIRREQRQGHGAPPGEEQQQFFRPQ